MTTITLQELQADVLKVLDQLQPGQDIVIVNHGQPIARMQKENMTTWPCQAGSAKDAILWIAPDFDAPLDDFREYME